jgi:hypothetical protein
MPDHIDDIPVKELQIFDGDELIFDGSDPSTDVVIEPGTSLADIITALGLERFSPETAGDDTATGDDAEPGS